MKNKGLNILIFILIPWVAFAIPRPEGKFKKTKVIRRTYQVNPAGGSLQVENIYGNINILTWDQDSVDIKVTISVDGNNAGQVDKRLKGIDVLIEKNANHIQAETNVKTWYESWSFFDMLLGKSSKVNFKILYEIRMPATFNLKIINKYGDFYLDKLSGKLQLNMEYGRFDIGELLHDFNRINTDYLSLSSIDFIKGGSLNSDYSKIKISTAYRLDLNCDYSTITIGEVRFLHLNNDYGSIQVNDVKEVTGSGDYQTRYFSGVDYIRFNGDYGSLKIDRILPGFRRIDLTCDYSTVKITNPNDVPYRLEIDQQYGNFKQNGIKLNKEIYDNGDKTIRGYYKDKNTSSVIKLKMDYGNIKIIN